jgi:hypothetical protein
MFLNGLAFYLHHKFSSSGHSFFSYQGVDWFLLLLGLLDLDQSGDWINGLTIFWNKKIDY